MDFHGIDLNLLVAFDALMSERNVTRAAAHVGVSQPAMSAALSRLRKLLDDPLFLRNANGLIPTPRARELASPLSQALRQIETTLVRNPVFTPAHTSQTFTLGLSDYPAFVLLPSLLQTLTEQAPGVSLNVRTFNDRNHAIDLLDSGKIDAAVGMPPSHTDSRILIRPILNDEFVTIVSDDHPAIQHGMNLSTYLALPHILVSPEDERHGLVDQALAQHGKTRMLALTLPQMFAVPAIVAQTQMVATILKRVPLSSPVNQRLALFPPPITLPEVTYTLIWHRRNESHPAQQWLRALITELASSL